jgi:hypothetical protein
MRILINPYGRYTWQIVCYSAPLHLGGLGSETVNPTGRGTDLFY